MVALDLNVKELEEKFGKNQNVRISRCDVTNEKDFQQVVNDILLKENIKLYGIVNSAGIGKIISSTKI